MEYFGLGKGKADEGDAEDVFARLKLLEPDLSQFIDKLSANEEVMRFLVTSENRKDWMRLFRSFVERFDGPECGLVTTLSQLGSDWFGDGKKLRSGGLRRLPRPARPRTGGGINGIILASETKEERTQWNSTDRRKICCPFDGDN